MVTADDRAATERLVKAVDAIDTWVAAKPPVTYPNRGQLPCPNCTFGKLTYINLTHIKGAARCSTPECVDFAPLY